MVNISLAAEEGLAPSGKEMIYASIKPLITVVPIIFIILALIVIYISHRIAGPLNRLKQAMQKVGQGDFSSKLKFRKYDEIHDVADTFNAMVDELAKKFPDKGALSNQEDVNPPN